MSKYFEVNKDVSASAAIDHVHLIANSVEQYCASLNAANIDGEVPAGAVWLIANAMEQIQLMANHAACNISDKPELKAVS